MANRWTTRRQTEEERRAEARRESLQSITRGIYQIGNNWRRDIGNKDPKQRYTQPTATSTSNSP